jgi:hypothetical protein
MGEIRTSARNRDSGTETTARESPNPMSFNDRITTFEQAASRFARKFLKANLRAARLWSFQIQLISNFQYLCVQG